MGSCSDFALIAALTPKKKHEPDKPSQNWNDYDVPDTLPPDLVDKIGTSRDLMNKE